MLAEKHNDENLANRLLIVGTGLIAVHFWYNKNYRHNNNNFGGRD